MTDEQIRQEGEKAYKIEKEAGNILDVNSAVAFKLGWDAAVKLFRQADVKFQLPSGKQLIDIAILFNDGKLERQKLADMVGMCQFVIDRLYENGNVMQPSSKEEGN